MNIQSKAFLTISLLLEMLIILFFIIGKVSMLVFILLTISNTACILMIKASNKNKY